MTVCANLAPAILTVRAFIYSSASASAMCAINKKLCQSLHLFVSLCISDVCIRNSVFIYTSASASAMCAIRNSVRAFIYSSASAAAMCAIRNSVFIYTSASAAATMCAINKKLCRCLHLSPASAAAAMCAINKKLDPVASPSSG